MFQTIRLKVKGKLQFLVIETRKMGTRILSQIIKIGKSIAQIGSRLKRKKAAIMLALGIWALAHGKATTPIITPPVPVVAQIERVQPNPSTMMLQELRVAPMTPEPQVKMLAPDITNVSSRARFGEPRTIQHSLVTRNKEIIASLRGGEPYLYKEMMAKLAIIMAILNSQPVTGFAPSCPAYQPIGAAAMTWGLTQDRPTQTCAMMGRDPNQSRSTTEYFHREGDESHKAVYSMISQSSALEDHAKSGFKNPEIKKAFTKSTNQFWAGQGGKTRYIVGTDGIWEYKSGASRVFTKEEKDAKFIVAACDKKNQEAVIDMVKQLYPRK